jgi:hypothetical protein
MAGEQVPLVMIPRFTTYGGAETFTTIPMDVTDYQAATLSVWRGALVSATTFQVTAQESTDQEVWSTCAGTNCSNYDPLLETEGQVVATIKKRWFRLRVVLAYTAGTPYPLATCWAVGFLEERE